ncbi:ATP-binding protein [Bacteroides nordii]|jgi:hypothetical protein|uniref:ATP-binding protein n=1 Tax=Bacteroides nordii TaxID=291645 RepID=UPI0018AA2412|nr:ATP-binding protein [Bacteroides nordii]
MAIKRALTVQNMIEMKTKQLPFEGEWYNAFEKPDATGTWFIYGNSSNGKTSFTLRLAKYLSELNLKVAYLSLEEHGTTSFKRAIIREKLLETREGKILFPAPESFKEFVERVESQKSPDVFIIDTIQRFKGQLDAEAYYDLVKRNPNKLFIILSHVEGKEPDGKLAIEIMRDACLKIFVEGQIAFSKGRSIGPKGAYVIWKEGAIRVHGEEMVNNILK